jgi:hypothetical protein
VVRREVWITNLFPLPNPHLLLLHLLLNNFHTSSKIVTVWKIVWRKVRSEDGKVWIGEGRDWGRIHTLSSSPRSFSHLRFPSLRKPNLSWWFS